MMNAQEIPRLQTRVAPEFLASIIENSNDAIFSRTSDGAILTWNKSAERLFGYTAAEAIGQHVSLIVPPDRAHEPRERWARVMQDLPVPPHETVRVAKDGRRIAVSSSLSAVRDDAGAVIGASIIIQDITERKREEEMRARLAAIVENAPDAIIGRALDGRVTSWNAAAERMLGYTAAEAIDVDLTTTPPDRQHETPENRRLLRTGKPIPGYETVRVARDGRRIDVLLSGSPIKDDNGNVIGTATILRDITERKHAAAVARESEERFRAVFEQAAVGMALRGVDPRNPHWLRVNQKLCDLLGYTREELLRLTSDDITPPEEREAARKNYERIVRGETASFSRDKRYVRKDGQIIWANISVSAVNGPDGRPTHVISVIQDITERLEAEKHLRLSAAVFATTQEGIVVTDASKRIISVNPAFTRITGCTPGDAIGKSPRMLSSGTQDGDAGKNMWAAIDSTERWQGELWDRRRNGELFCAWLSISIVKNPLGEIVYRTANLADITQSKRAEQARANLAAIVDSSNDAIISRDHHRTIVSWNAAAERLFGYTADEVIGQHASLLIPPDREAEAARNRALLAQGHAVSDLETIRLAKCGQRLQVSLSQAPVMDASGVVVGASLTFRNIAERKQAEAARARLAAIVENSSDAIIARSLNMTILSWNAAAERLFGYTTAEAVGQPISIILPPDHVSGAEKNSRQLLSGADIAPTEVVRLTKDGRRIDVMRSISPIKNEFGEMVGAAVTIRDISERKRAAEALAQLAAIVEASNDAIVSRTQDGTILTWNKGAERIFGYTAAEMIGRNIVAIVPPNGVAEMQRNHAATMRGKELPHYESWRLNRNGRRVDVSISANRILDPAGNVERIALIFRDISERKRAERELQRKAELALLLETLARAANEATTPEEALQVCVARICDYGNWTLGRVGIFAPGRARGVPQSSIWHCSQPERFDEFMRISDSFDHTLSAGAFTTAALREKKPVWVSDLSGATGFGRLASAVKHDIQSGFVFPVVVGERAAAFLEFFACEVREPDEMFLDAITTIGSQLARMIERQYALDKVRANEQKLDSILGALQEVVWSMDPRSGRLLYLNCAAKRLARRPLGDFLAKPRLWRRMIHREDRTAVFSDMRKLMADGRLIHEFRLVLADGEVRTVENRAQVVRNAEGEPQRIDGTITDITERKQAEERIDYLAQYDAVTGLPNRRLFNDRLTLAIARHKRLGTMTALLLLDLDRFKQINESLGHSGGDKVLQAVAARLNAGLREVDTVARLGGDEFAVVLEGITDKSQAYRIAEKIVETMGEPLVLDGEEIFVTASIGVAVYPANADSVEELIENAESAMYQAKQDGRNGMFPYAPNPNPRRGGLGMESKLRRAIERDELLLNFQPKVCISSGAVIGAEALVRWRNPDLGLVSPANFIPLAEETGLIVPIGEWVLRTACAQASAWRRDGYQLTMAVNLSARQFRQKDLIGTIKRALTDTGLAPANLELEITESMIMHRPEQTIATLQRMHDLGLKLSVDDFGTGYSSLSYLKRFPVHKLKVDQSFVRELHQNADDAAIVRAVIALAQSLNLKTIAEGVETREQLEYLTTLNCNEYQGYYFSKPVSAEEFMRVLIANETRDPGVPKTAAGGARLHSVSGPRRGDVE